MYDELSGNIGREIAARAYPEEAAAGLDDTTCS